MHIGDVYMMCFEGDGNEQRGWRPAVVFQNNKGNAHSPNIIALPMTSVLKKSAQPTHVIVRARDTGLRHDSMVLCENPKCVSKDKVGMYITSLSHSYMQQIAKGSLLATAALAFLDQAAIEDVLEKTAQLNACA